VLPRVAASEPGRAYLTQELRWEPQARVFTFPTAIDVDNIQARIERGMLRVRVPKAEGAPSRVITVEG
jgi:HSP20 family molecular chaperone IbpA